MLIFLLLIPLIFCCIHDQLGHNYKLLQLNDTDQVHHRRILQQSSKPTIGNLRIHLDFSLFNTTSTKGKNLVNIIQIARSFWEITIELERLNNLIFPVSQGQNKSSILCYDLTVPERIVNSNLQDRDYGFIVQELSLGPNGQVARSFPCAQLQSTRRPVWALISFNSDFFQYDPISFQNSVHVAIHQMTHCLGFSYILYSSYVNGNPTVMVNGQQYLNSSAIQRQLKRQYNCENAPGMLIENNGPSGTAGSHWSRKAIGNQYMTATVMVVNPTISYVSLALLETTGWYTKINTHYGNTVNFGLNAGCKMLDLVDCSPQQFCKTSEQKSCDFDYLAGSHCITDSYSGSCSYFQYYSNYICIDPTYSNKNINNFGNTGQSPAYNSRCFTASIRGVGQTQPKYDMRCYVSVCSRDRRTITLQIGTTKILCQTPNQKLSVPGFDGTITCPKDFDRFCRAKSCPHSCYSNGACIKGDCICSRYYTGSYCRYPSGESEGAVMAMDRNSALIEKDMVCMLGTYLTEFGDCMPCGNGCAKCDLTGCNVCYNGNLPAEGKCQ